MRTNVFKYQEIYNVSGVIMEAITNVKDKLDYYIDGSE